MTGCNAPDNVSIDTPSDTHRRRVRWSMEYTALSRKYRCHSLYKSTIAPPRRPGPLRASLRAILNLRPDHQYHSFNAQVRSVPPKCGKEMPRGSRLDINSLSNLREECSVNSVDMRKHSFDRIMIKFRLWAYQCTDDVRLIRVRWRTGRCSVSAQYTIDTRRQVLTSPDSLDNALIIPPPMPSI